MIKFTYESGDGRLVEHTIDDSAGVTAYDLVEEFSYFMLAISYHPLSVYRALDMQDSLDSLKPKDSFGRVINAMEEE